MTRGSFSNTQTGALVGMGETVLVRPDEAARAVVGSCVGLVLYEPRCQLAAVAHIVLPDAADRNAKPGKFADTAIPHLLALLEQEGVRHGGLIAKIAGGAQMFVGSPDGPWQIGEANVRAVTTGLAKLAIPIQGMSVGGNQSRKLSFCCDSGQMTVEITGQEPITV